MQPETLEHYRDLARQALASLTPYPEGRFSGRGLVICGGGRKYFPCAWVCIKMLRHQGCRLPIELFHLGPYELDESMRAAVAPLGVRCVDAFELRRTHPVRHLGGWELKPYALLHCSFEEVVLLDADNVALIDPQTLFAEPRYRETGALFWPDFHAIERDNPIWQVTEVPYRYEPAFESGQMVLDKRRCWQALQLTMHYNEHSDFYYRYSGGDKDTFHLAFRRLEQAYALVPYHVRTLDDVTMLQHDFEGRLIFQHRHHAKWRLDPALNERIEGFLEQERCLEYLAELRERWSGVVARPLPDSDTARRLHAEIVAVGRYVYHRVGYERRCLRLAADRSITEGAAAMERAWHVELDEQGRACLCLSGDSLLTCRLWRRSDGAFVGRWLSFERMPVELLPFDRLPLEERLELERQSLESGLVERPALLLRGRGEKRLVVLARGGQVVARRNNRKAGPLGLAWSLVCRSGGVALDLVEHDGLRRALTPQLDGTWREHAAADSPVFIPLPAEQG